MPDLTDEIYEHIARGESMSSSQKGSAPRQAYPEDMINPDLQSAGQLPTFRHVSLPLPPPAPSLARSSTIHLGTSGARRRGHPAGPSAAVPGLGRYVPRAWPSWSPTWSVSGTLTWDTTKPDGTPRKLLDTSKVNALGVQPTISLEDGLRNTYAWFLQHVDTDARL